MDHQLAQRAAQRKALAHGGEQVQPSLGQWLAVRQHRVQVEDTGALGDDALDQRSQRGVVQVGVPKMRHAALSEQRKKIMGRKP